MDRTLGRETTVATFDASWREFMVVMIAGGGDEGEFFEKILCPFREY